jgi:hypothetical protein
MEKRQAIEAAANRLEEIRQTMEALRDEAMWIVNGCSDVINRDAAYRGWNASIEMALSNETHWVGKASTTLEETIEQLEEADVAEE